MDGSAFRHLNFGWVFWWAGVGLILTGILSIAGLSFLVYFLAHHLSWH